MATQQHTSTVKSRQDLEKELADVKEQLRILNNVIALAPEHLYWIDRNGQYLGCNIQQAKMFGFKTSEQFVGLYNEDLFHLLKLKDNRYLQELNHTNEQVMSTGEAISKEEEAIFIDGLSRVFRSSKSPMKDESGTVIGMIGVSIDITQQKEIERLEQEKLKTHEAFAKTCTQIAHDIRSPAMALGMLMHRANSMPEASRILVRQVTQRIQDIASNLLEAHKGNAVDTGHHLTAHLISLMMESVAAEKRVQYGGEEIEILLDMIPSERFLFAKVQQADFKRMLSNLLNNAIEARIPEQPLKIRLTLKEVAQSHEPHLQLKIHDNGKGMSPEVLEKVKAFDGSYGKVGGYGLGLTHAVDTLKPLKGAIDFESTEGVGTTVTLTLPKTDPPAWMPLELKLAPHTTVVILDDDEAIHSAWDGRFSEFQGAVHLQHFRDPEVCSEWLSTQPISHPFVLLFDHELLGHQLTGLEVAQQFPQLPCILVTSYYEKRALLDACQTGVIKLLPKSLAPSFEITLSE